MLFNVAGNWSLEMADFAGEAGRRRWIGQSSGEDFGTNLGWIDIKIVQNVAGHVKNTIQASDQVSLWEIDEKMKRYQSSGSARISKRFWQGISSNLASILHGFASNQFGLQERSSRHRSKSDLAFDRMEFHVNELDFALVARKFVARRPGCSVHPWGIFCWKIEGKGFSTSLSS